MKLEIQKTGLGRSQKVLNGQNERIGLIIRAAQFEPYSNRLLVDFRLLSVKLSNDLSVIICTSHVMLI